jgi:hypothetical protein
LARFCSYTFWYSAVSGASWPGPLGLLGSHTPGGLPRFHSVFQSGYFFVSSALAAIAIESTDSAIASAKALIPGFAPWRMAILLLVSVPAQNHICA